MKTNNLNDGREYWKPKPTKEELTQLCQTNFAKYKETKDLIFLEIACKYKVQADRYKYDDVNYCNGCKFQNGCPVIEGLKEAKNEN